MLALIGGLIFTFLVFYVIPLMKKLEEGKRTETTALQTKVVEEPPEELDFEDEPPPPEEDEPPPPEPEIEPEPMDIADLPIDLGAGIGGKMMLDLKPNFDVAQDPNDLGGGDLDTPPRATTKIPPRYPQGLLKKRVSGRVLVAMTVDETGKVTNAVVKETSGYGDMDKAALNAAKRWKFKPGIKGGRKAVMTVVQPFNFKMKN